MEAQIEPEWDDPDGGWDPSRAKGPLTPEALVLDAGPQGLRLPVLVGPVVSDVRESVSASFLFGRG